MCRSGNASENSCEGDDSGAAFDTDAGGVCVVERLLSISGRDSMCSLPFMLRLLASSWVLVLSDGARNGRMVLEVEAAEVPVDQFARHHLAYLLLREDSPSEGKEMNGSTMGFISC
jgi:hypothetical protein